MIRACFAATSPHPGAIRRVAQDVIQRPEYQLEPGSDYETSFWVWLLDLLRWMFRPLWGLFNLLNNISPVLAWLVIVLLIVVLFALIAHIVYTFRQALIARRPGPGDQIRAAAPPDPTALERQARAAAAAADHIGAVRLLFRACLLRLQQSDRRPFRRGITNRELLRRYQSSPAGGALAVFVETIDRKWYGYDACTPDDYQQCVLAHEQIRRTAGELAHAHGA